jgi:hypothetical protein
MDKPNEFFCVVKCQSEDLKHGCEPSMWTTYSWTDEFGNSVAPFFTSLESGQPFVETMIGWQLMQNPISLVVQAILADIVHETVFYTIDPLSTVAFKALSPTQFLTELIYRNSGKGIEDPLSSVACDRLVPIDALFGKRRDLIAEIEYKQLLAVADLIFGIDLKSGKQTIVYGKLTLEELVRTGQSNILGVVNVEVEPKSLEIEKLAMLVQDIKGHHDYCAAGTEPTD